MSKLDNVDASNIKHIAIIMDGNGRWAKKRLMPRTYGHGKGANNIKLIAKACDRIGIKAMTVYAFSTENWKRDKDEVDYLMNLPIDYLNKNFEELLSSNIKIQFLGRKDRFKKELLDTLYKIEEITKDHSGLILSICLDYGSYDEITTAVKNICAEVVDGKLDIESITPEVITNHLFTKDLPPLDLLIRTSGEERISNYLLWQLAYSELYFTDCFWPDFDEDELALAIESFNMRNRRFGGIKK